MADDQSDTAFVVARKADADKFVKDPSLLKGKEILLTTNSTGHYAAVACLKKLGLGADDVRVVNLGPSQMIAAYSSGNGTLAAGWPPFRATRWRKKPMPSRSAPAVTVVPRLPQRWLSVRTTPPNIRRRLPRFWRFICGSVAWQKKHPAETMAYMKAFYVQGGTTLSDASIKVDCMRSARSSR